MSPDSTLPRPGYAQPNPNIDAESTWQWIKRLCISALQILRFWLDPRYRVRWKYKALWAFLNVMLPELALAVALDERQKSKDLIKALHDLDNKSETHKHTPLFTKWNTTIGFYAIMGGFYV